MRKRRAVKRDVLPDSVYNSKVVTRLVNTIMKDGKNLSQFLKKNVIFPTTSKSHKLSWTWWPTCANHGYEIKIWKKNILQCPPEV